MSQTVHEMKEALWGFGARVAVHQLFGQALLDGYMEAQIEITDDADCYEVDQVIEKLSANEERMFNDKVDAACDLIRRGALDRKRGADHA